VLSSISLPRPLRKSRSTALLLPLGFTQLSSFQLRALLKLGSNLNFVLSLCESEELI
jgi:hypothetical protein